MSLHLQPQSFMLCLPHETIAKIIGIYCQSKEDITLAAIMLIINCAAACKQLRAITNLVQTTIDATEFAMDAKTMVDNDKNINGTRVHVPKLNGGIRLRTNKVDKCDNDTGIQETNGTSILIVRNCDKDNGQAFGTIHVLLAVPVGENKDGQCSDNSECVHPPYICNELCIDEGLRILSGHHLHKSIAHPNTKLVSKFSNNLTKWPLIGLSNDDKEKYVHNCDEQSSVEDESVVEIKSSKSKVPEIRGIVFKTSYCGSNALSNITTVLPVNYLH